jgi:hypothetical protein
VFIRSNGIQITTQCAIFHLVITVRTSNLHFSQLLGITELEVGDQPKMGVLFAAEGGQMVSENTIDVLSCSGVFVGHRAYMDGGGDMLLCQYNFFEGGGSLFY